jgi:SAM-dependent methyltransferase
LNLLILQLQQWNYLKKYGLNKILIAGFGYGRNAKVFTDNGIKVTGIEISETAIDLAKKHYGDNIKVYPHNPALRIAATLSHNFAINL